MRRPGFAASATRWPAVMLLAGLWAGGCVVSEIDREGFGSRATGTRGIELGGGAAAAGANADWPNAALAAGMTPAAAFAPPGEATAGRGTPVAITLDPPPLAAGEVRRVDARVAIDVVLRDVAATAATGAPAGSPAAAFTGRTAGTLRGWLSVDEVDAVGGLRRGRFLTEDASLIRDGELLARIPAGRVADLVPSGDRFIVRVDGEPLGESASRLLELCLRAPLATRDWDRIAGTGPGRPHRRGDTWAIEPQAAAAMLGADAAAAAGATGTAALAAGGRWLEMRSRTAAVADDRIIDAFGPSLADLPEAACIHRFAVDGGGGDGGGGFARVSLLTHRFELLEGRGRLAGERTERIDIRLGEDRRGE